MRERFNAESTAEALAEIFRNEGVRFGDIVELTIEAASDLAIVSRGRARQRTAAGRSA